MTGAQMIQEIDRLIAVVEAGDDVDGRLSSLAFLAGIGFGPAGYLCLAANGSFDAALRLHNELHHDRKFDIWRTYDHPVDGGASRVVYGVNIPGADTVYDAVPSRAFLIAQLKAYRAKHEGAGIELMPCPFCGDVASFRHEKPPLAWLIRCGNCGAQAGGTAFRNDAWNARQWNRRARVIE